MNIHFLVFDRVEELDLVGSWELLAQLKKCSPPKLVTLNAMIPVGEHGMKFVADAHSRNTLERYYRQSILTRPAVEKSIKMAGSVRSELTCRSMSSPKIVLLR